MERHRPKVLICIGSNRWGGGEKHCCDLICSLKDKFDFSVAVKSDGILSEHIKSLEFPVFEFPFSKNINIRECKTWIRFLKEHHFDLIHAHLNMASFRVSLIKPWIKTPVVSTIHGFSTPVYYLFPDRLISVSEAIHNSLLPFQKNKSETIYNGIETPDLHEHKPEKAFVFATIHPNKGQEFIIKALDNHSISTELILVGTGQKNHEQAITDLISKRDDSKIQHINKTMDLDEFWKQAKFIIIPSFKEALSYVAMESLSRGIPVLASKTGGLTEVITNNLDGLFFEPGNASDFVTKFKTMEKDWETLNQNLKKCPLLKRKPKFQLKQMTNSIGKLYENIIRK
jgi:glycosyltransferase involved in cell wall biosynthesis